MVLEGIKVADFTWATSGPLLTKTLADYGATVVQAEGTDNSSRRWVLIRMVIRDQTDLRLLLTGTVINTLFILT